MMTKQEEKELLLQEKLVVLFRRVPVEKAGAAAKALFNAGVRFLELTFDQLLSDPVQNFNDTVQAVREAVGDRMILGGGTVLTEAQVEAVCRAGGRFIVSPGTSEKVVKKTLELGMLSIPGAMTPSEIMHAWELGADIVKLFPADDLGYHYIWNIRGPLTHIPLMATGGINPETIPLFLEKGINAVGTGVSILKRELLDADDYEGITALAKAHIDAIKSAAK